MLIVAMMGMMLGLACVLALASPWPWLAPMVIGALAVVAFLYRRPGWGLLGLVVLVPLEGLFKELAFSPAKFLGASLIGILLMQLLLRQLPEGRARSNLWPLLLLFLLWVGLSFLFSSNHPASLGNLRELLIGMTLFGIVLLVGRDLPLLPLCRLLVISVAATCLIALFSARHQVQGRAVGLLQDANYFALLITVAMPLAVLLAMRARHWLTRFLWLGLGVVLLAGMTRTDSRSGLVVLLLALLVGLWHHRARLARIRPRHLGFIMLGAALLVPLGLMSVPDDYVERIKSLSILRSGVNAHQDASLGRRASYLLVGGEMIREDPVFGGGPGTFALRYATTGYAKAFSDSSDSLDIYRRAHNTYLEIFAEMGIPAGLLFLALLLMGWRNFERARRAWLDRGERELADLVVHLGLAFFSMTLFLLFLSVPNHKLLWLLLGLSWVLRQQAESGGPAEVRSA